MHKTTAILEWRPVGHVVHNDAEYGLFEVHPPPVNDTYLLKPFRRGIINDYDDKNNIFVICNIQEAELYDLIEGAYSKDINLGYSMLKTIDIMMTMYDIDAHKYSKTLPEKHKDLLNIIMKAKR